MPQTGTGASVLGTVQVWTEGVVLPQKKLPLLSHNDPYGLGKAVSGVANTRCCSASARLTARLQGGFVTGTARQIARQVL